MDFPATVHHGKLSMTPAIRQARETYLARHKDGTAMMETLTAQRPGKTDAQLKAYFGLLIVRCLDEFDQRGWDVAMITGADIPPGVEMTKTLLTEWLYGIYGEGKRLSNMDTVEAARFFDNCQGHAARTWEIYIPDPDPELRK